MLGAVEGHTTPDAETTDGDADRRHRSRVLLKFMFINPSQVVMLRALRLKGVPIFSLEPATADAARTSAPHVPCGWPEAR